MTIAAEARDVEALYLELVETLPPANRAELARLLLDEISKHQGNDAAGLTAVGSVIGYFCGRERGDP